jgi:hypothetical protein
MPHSPCLLVCICIVALPAVEPLADPTVIDTGAGIAAPATTASPVSPDRFELLVGGGLRMVWWEAESSVDTISRAGGGTSTLARTHYDIASTIFLTARGELRWGRTSAAVSYLRSRAEDEIDLPDPVSDRILGMVNIKELIGSQSLRLIYETGALAGTATWSRTAAGSAPGQDPGTVDSADFAQTYERVAVHLQGDRIYGGIEWSRLDMPMAIGLSDRDFRIRYLAFDRGFSGEFWSMVGGVDTLSAIANGSIAEGGHLYCDLAGGFLIGFYDIGRKLRRSVEADGWRLDDGWAAGINARLDLGYAWLRRHQPVGFGGWWRLGFTVEGSFILDGQFADDGPTLAADELAYEWNRWDLRFGPFIDAGFTW